jgi:hypothetical protein
MLPIPPSDTLSGAPLRIAEPPDLIRTIGWVVGGVVAMAATLLVGFAAAGLAAAVAWAR